MEGAFSLDHVVVLVEDLAAGTEDFTALGFIVVQGGEHTGRGSHNALITFADGSYLELIAFKHRSAPPDLRIPKQVRARELIASQSSPAERRVRAWETAGEGLVDFALLPGAIEEVIAGAGRRGLALEGPLPGGRLRPDGQQVAWQLGIPDAFDLPFLCADVTPRSLRLPDGAARQHTNGVMGIMCLLVLVTDLDFSVPRYRALLGVEPAQGSAFPWPDAQTVDFVLGSATITLAEPTGKSSPLCDYLNRCGEGPYALRLRTNDRARAGMLDPARTHGAQIEMVFEGDNKP
ncbi:MAG: VOC family protein [Candidatus Methylomirabilales bacterium]